MKSVSPVFRENRHNGRETTAFRCLMSEVPIGYDYIRKEGLAGRMGTKLMAIVAKGTRGRLYLPPLLDMKRSRQRRSPMEAGSCCRITPET